MGTSLSLVDRAWLPVQIGGAVERVGLRDLFCRSHEIDDLAVSVPPAAAGLWRILYAITARVTGLDRSASSGWDWIERREAVLEAGRFDVARVDEYFTQYRDRFDLFGPDRPFLQDPRLADQCPKTSGVNKLVVGRPAGNNQSWFGGHHLDSVPSPIPSDEAILYLITWHYYGPSGRCATRNVGRTSSAQVSAGPLRGVVSFHPVGDTLFESLVTGLVPPDKGEGLCPWELPDLPDPNGVRPRLAGFCSDITGRSQHAVLLTPSEDGNEVVDAVMTWAWPAKIPGARDPYVIWRTNAKTSSSYALGADADRAIWRDLDALLLRERHRNTSRDQRPAVFDAAAELPIQVLDRLRVRALGFDQDGQTRDRQWYSALTPAVLQNLERDGQYDVARRAGMLTAAAEDVEWRLSAALLQVWREINKGPAKCPWIRHAQARYWPEAESRFWSDLNAARDGHPAEPFRNVAVHIFDEITESVVGASLRAGAVAARSRGLIFASTFRKAA